MFYFNILHSYSLDHLLWQIPVIQFPFTEVKGREAVSNSSWYVPEIIQSHQVHCLAKKEKKPAADLWIKKEKIYDSPYSTHFKFLWFWPFFKLDDKSQKPQYWLLRKKFLIAPISDVFYVPLTYHVCGGTLTQTCWMVRKQLEVWLLG